MVWSSKSTGDDPPVKESCETCSYGTNLDFGVSANFVVTLNSRNVIMWFERWDFSYVNGFISSRDQFLPEYGIEVIEHFHQATVFFV